MNNYPSAPLASRQFSKVLQVCPFCRNAQPKELVEMPSQTVSYKVYNTNLILLVMLLTCGIGVLFAPLMKKTEYRKQGGGLMVYCPQCHQPFPSQA